MALVLSMVSMLLAPVSRMATVFLMSSTARVSRPSRVMASGVRNPGPGDHLQHSPTDPTSLLEMPPGGSLRVTLATWRNNSVDGLQLSHCFLHVGV